MSPRSAARSPRRPSGSDRAREGRVLEPRSGGRPRPACWTCTPGREPWGSRRSPAGRRTPCSSTVAQAAAAIHRNLDGRGSTGRATVHTKDVLAFLTSRRPGAPFDLVFCRSPVRPRSAGAGAGARRRWPRRCRPGRDHGPHQGDQEFHACHSGTLGRREAAPLRRQPRAPDPAREGRRTGMENPPEDGQDTRRVRGLDRPVSGDIRPRHQRPPRHHRARQPDLRRGRGRACSRTPPSSPLFGLEERVSMLEEACSALANVRVAAFGGLLVDFAGARGGATIVKGLRAISDYEFEIQMAQMNHRLGGGGDPVHAHQPQVVVPVVLAGQGGRPLRGRRRGPRARPGRRSGSSTGWRSADVDITARLNQLDELVREAKAMPLSSSVLVNRDEVLELLAEMQEALPDEIKQARWIVKDREELLAKAKADGERIVAAAHESSSRWPARKPSCTEPTKKPSASLAEAERAGPRHAATRPRSTWTPSWRSSRSRCDGSWRNRRAPSRRWPRPSIRSRSGATSSARPAPPPSRSSERPTEVAAPTRARPAVRRGAVVTIEPWTSAISSGQAGHVAHRRMSTERWRTSAPNSPAYGTRPGRGRPAGGVPGRGHARVGRARVARMALRCARCLKDFEQPFSVELHEMFVPAPEEDTDDYPSIPRG